MRSKTRNLLFVCEFNSCRSQLAEALARSVTTPEWRILSAGLKRTIVNEEVLRALAEVNVDASTLRSKSLDEIGAEKIDAVVVLAAPAVEDVSRRFPKAQIYQWLMDDPVQARGGADAVPRAVRSARDDIMNRIRELFRSVQD